MEYLEKRLKIIEVVEKTNNININRNIIFPIKKLITKTMKKRTHLWTPNVLNTTIKPNVLSVN